MNAEQAAASADNLQEHKTTSTPGPRSKEALKLCRVRGCRKRWKAWQLCDPHYRRFRKYGSPHGMKQVQHHGLTPAARFAKWLDPQPNGCVHWTGQRNEAGYGRFWIGGRSRHVQAHRFAYELANGAIYREAHIDHICENTRCVRPDHLQEVTPFLNNALKRIRKGRCEGWERQACLVQGIRIHLDDEAPASAAADVPFESL